MTYLTLLAAAVPTTVTWSPKVALVMAACNLLAIAFGKTTIKLQNEGPPTPAPDFFGGMSLGAVIGCWCFGHVLGIGSILGLANLGFI